MIIAPVPRIATICGVSERVHHSILNLISIGIGIYALTLLNEALSGDGGSFATLSWLLVGIFALAVAFGFKKRRGWAFLAVSVALLFGWVTQLVRVIVVYDAGEMGKGHGILLSFLLINVMIAYLGRWSMERRFRPHLADH